MVCFCALYMCERYRIYHVCECKCCMNVAWWHMMNVRSATICPPSSLSSWWPLCCFLFLSSLSLHRCLSHFQRFSSPHPFSHSPFFRTSSNCCVLCMCIHARPRTLIQSHAHTHTSLSLFNHWLYYTGYIPRQCHRRRWARLGWMRGGRSLYPSSHGSHTTGTPTDWDEWI